MYKFEAVSPATRLDELAYFGKVMQANNTPDSWTKIKALSTRRARIIQLLRVYTSALNRSAPI